MTRKATPRKVEDERLEQAAERAYLAFGGPGADLAAWADLADAYKQAWRNAASAAGAVGATVIRLPCDPYLTTGTFDWARAVLGGVQEDQCMVFSTAYHAAALREIGDLGARAIELPQDALASRDAWIVVAPDGTVFSVPKE